MKNGDGGATGAAELVKDHGAGAVEVTINAQSVQVDDPVLPGRQLLSAGGFNPAADYTLIRILKAGAELIGLDERIDLRREGPFIFKAFASDRSFNFTIDDRGYVWGAASITEEELRDITGLEDDKIFLLERKNKPDLDLGPGDVVHLDKGGAERLRTRKGTVKVKPSERM